MESKYDPYSAPEADIRGVIQENVRELSLSALEEVSASTNVPYEALVRGHSGENLPMRFLPPLYLHLFGPISPELAKQSRVDHGN